MGEVKDEPIALADFHSFGHREIDGLRWRLLGEARSIDYTSHHVMIKLWGTDQATNTVFNLQMEIAKYWTPPKRRWKQQPRQRVVPVATWDEHFPEERMSSQAVGRFHQLKHLVAELYDNVRWGTDDRPRVAIRFDEEEEQ